MADTPQNDTFRVTSITHGATPIPDSTGGSIDEECGWVESRPGARISPATALDSFGASAVARGQKRFAPIVRGTSATLTFNVLEIGQGAGSIAIATMLAGDYHFNGNVKPHEHEQRFKYNAGGTENLAPVSIT